MSAAPSTILEGIRRNTSSGFDVEEVRRDFPILSEKVRGKPLVYLDSAATTQKPRVVIERLDRYYRTENANIHRGIHFLSERATEAYEEARATDAREIVFVRGTTEAINLVAQSYGRKFIGEGDEIIVSAMEHHSNIVPWQILREQVGADLRVIPMNNHGELLVDEYERLFSDQTKLVAVTHVSNALGTINPVGEIIRIAHRRGVPVMVDGAQAVPHLRVDVREIDCDFYAFSGHKLYGPTGVGVLYGKASLLDAMPPYQGGGDMISSVTFEKTLYNVLPYKFEAGTPNIAGAIGLGAAIDYLSKVRLDLVAAHERELLAYATEAVSAIKGVRIIGTAREKAAVLSFVLDGVHAHDVGTILDQDGIAIRAGHHCAMPVMERFGVPATARASLALYNQREEVDALVGAIEEVKRVFGR
jgi:cysteine desulfurase/selenocysteine lyase